MSVREPLLPPSINTAREPVINSSSATMRSHSLHLLHPPGASGVAGQHDFLHPSNLHLPSPSANLFERSMNALVSNFKGTIAKSAAAAAAAAAATTTTPGSGGSGHGSIGSNGSHPNVPAGLSVVGGGVGAFGGERNDEWDWENGFGGMDVGLGPGGEFEGQDLLGLFTAPAQTQQQQSLGVLSPSTENLFHMDHGGGNPFTPGGSLRTDIFSPPSLETDFATYAAYNHQEMLPLTHPVDTREFHNPAFDYIVGSFLDTIDNMTPAITFDPQSFEHMVKPSPGTGGGPHDVAAPVAGKPVQYSEDMLLLNFDDVAASIALKKQAVWGGQDMDSPPAALSGYDFNGNNGEKDDNRLRQLHQHQQPLHEEQRDLRQQHQQRQQRLQQQQQQQHQQQQQMPLRPAGPAANVQAPVRIGPGAGAAASRYSPPGGGGGGGQRASSIIHQSPQEPPFLHQPPQVPSHQLTHSPQPKHEIRHHPYAQKPGMLAKAPTLRSHPVPNPQQYQQHHQQMQPQQHPIDHIVYSHQSPQQQNQQQQQLQQPIHQYGAAPQQQLHRQAQQTDILPCVHCPKVFSSYSQLAAHVQTHSTGGGGGISGGAGGVGVGGQPPHKSKPYHCTMCPQTFSRSHDLKRHYYIHTQEKPYRCKRCSKGFSRRDALKRHEKSVREGKKVHCREGDPGDSDEDEDDEEMGSGGHGGGQHGSHGGVGGLMVSPSIDGSENLMGSGGGPPGMSFERRRSYAP
ncbi:hypothetical protein HDU89_005495 [Geranomyces variabilis]|nr:hypothetical protein HDU89_005495 [Geranomyces variabilis]